ncbi:SUN domain-containing protein 2 [Physcomitrium patens]|uniref:SUN domain-containing protein n=1 Tax=Physcomitrium patens TaxID=3218 RepID=A0A2K1KAB2_PHYPA|nr:SUN domain-containing protein 2-like [Physcomitrium patens]PNR50714.1 hypothetical protein PHYPA_009900 [Physcomitrium patens]|eukprot:XP_024380768.1 SUN domain-containing protein 2-like [Physcomitrella patens]
MSAATVPSTTTGNALSGGAAPERVATKPRKRTTPASKVASEATEAPLLAATHASAVTRARRAREPRTSLEEVAMAFPTRDANGLHDDDVAAGVTHENNTPPLTPTTKKPSCVVDTASDKASPSKHKISKPAIPKGKVKKKTSLWATMGHLFSPSYLLLFLAVGVGAAVWSLRPKAALPEWYASSNEVGKLEEFMTKTTKWIQVQLEVLDMKIEKGSNDLRNEFKEKLDSQVAEMESGVKDLKAQVDRLYQGGGPLNRDEVIELVKKFMEHRASDSTGKSFSLEDVRSIARKIVMSEVEKHAADGIGRTDYALASGGGRVVDHSEGVFLGRGRQLFSMVFSSILTGEARKHPLAQKVLEPSFGEPGECLPLKGSNVFVEISLRTAILPDAVTLEHVSKSVAYDLSSAPKEFQLYGWREARPADRSAQPSPVHRLLGQFVYKTDGPSNIQTFHLSKEDVGDEPINMVRLHVLSNYGSTLHTCIYRVRVHGVDPQGTL